MKETLSPKLGMGKPASADGPYGNRLTPTAHDMPQVSTALICKNSLLRAGLKQVLLDTQFFVMEEALDDRPTLSILRSTAPILIIVDVSHLPHDAEELVGRMKAQCPAGRIVVMSDQFQFDAMMQLHKAGVSGFCSTMIGRDVLVKSLELVMLGETVFPSSIVLSVFGEVSRRSERHIEYRSPEESPNHSAVKARKLSIREAEILSCLMDGSPNKVIARKFGLTEATVKVHVKAIMRKIGVGNRTQAALWATDYMPVQAGTSSS